MTRSGTRIELWLVDLDRCAQALDRLERIEPRLAAEDREHANAISDPREHRHRLVAYTALRILLERMAGPGVGRTPIVRTAGGKPRLDTGGAEFSLSHVDGLALIGISSTCPLGVDIERVRPVRMTQPRLAEITAVGAGLSDKRLPALGAERTFLQAWTRLEAFTKARGRSLSQTLADVGVRGSGRLRLSPGELEATARRVAYDAGLIVHDLNLSPGLHAAVGVPRGTPPLRARPFPETRAGISQLLAQ